jgi:hypothetical protein
VNCNQSLCLFWYIRSVAWSVTDFLQSQINSHCSVTWTQPACTIFVCVDFLFYTSLVLTVRFFHLHDVSHKSLFSLDSQMGFIFPPLKLFFTTHIYWHRSVVKTIIWQAIARVWRHQHITSILAYFDYMRVGGLQHRWQITLNATRNNQSTTDVIVDILLSHRWNPGVAFMCTCGISW